MLKFFIWSRKLTSGMKSLQIFFLHSPDASYSINFCMNSPLDLDAYPKIKLDITQNLDLDIILINYESSVFPQTDQEGE